MTTNMTNTHPIAAAPWQLARSPSMILLPLLPEPRDCGYSWTWDSEPLNLFWFKTEGVGDRLLKKLPWHVGDRIYLQEPWAHGFINGIGVTIMPARCFDPDEILDDIGLKSWQEDDPSCTALAGVQPAHTMPESAAQHWFAIDDVRVCQCKEISYNDFLNAGMFWNHAEPTFQTSMARQWNTAHPDYHWDGDRWVVVLAVGAIGS